MTPTRLIIVGGGEHARVVAEAALSRPGTFDVLGFVDPTPCPEMERRLGIRRLGDDGALASSSAQWVLGIGAVGVSSLRQDLVVRLGSAGAVWARVVAAHAYVSPTASLGEGTVIMAGAIVQSGAALGAHCVVNTGAVIEHDVRLGDFTQIGPAAAVGGGAVLGAGSYVGMGARVRDHVAIGSRVLIGMGAAVVGDVAHGMLVTGVPARAKVRPA